MRPFLAGHALALAVAVLGSSCKTRPAPEARDAGAPAQGPGADRGAHADEILARVGDRTITVGQYVAALEHMDQFDRLRYQAPERRQELLEEMINILLLADEARGRGYDKDPIAEQEIREILRDAMIHKAREGALPPSRIPDDASLAYYDKHRADFRDPERRRVSVIVAQSEAAANALLDVAKRASAVQWGELVRTRSVDARAKSSPQSSAPPSSPVDLAGDLGFVGPPGDARGANPRVPEEVRAAAFEVATVGDVVPHAVKSGARIYLVKLTARTDAHDRTFEDARRSIQVKLAQDAVHAKEEALLDELRRQFPVEIDEAALGEVRVDLPRDSTSAAPPRRGHNQADGGS